MSQQLIRRAFESRLSAWATAAGVPAVFENTPAAAPEVTYVRSYVLPARPSVLFLEGTGRTYRGVYQVSIFALPGRGPAEAEGLAAQLAGIFSPSLPMAEGGILVYMLEPLSQAPAIQDPDRYILPVSGRYRVDTA